MGFAARGNNMLNVGHRVAVLKGPCSWTVFPNS